MTDTRDDSVQAGEISIAAILVVLVREVRTIIMCGAVLALVGAASAFLATRTYTARVTFMPQGASSASALGALASQLGLQVGSRDPSSGPDFYASLLTSRTILRRIVADSFPDPLAPDTRRPLVDIFEVAVGEAYPKRIERGVRTLAGEIRPSVSALTGVVAFSVTSAGPELSGALASRLVDEVNSFNLQSRRTQASEERRFTMSRLAEAQDTLRAAERQLERFLEQNRAFINSPQLTFTHDRLRRAVALHQQIVSSLAASVEEARLREVRDMPVITVIDEPVIPAVPDSRGALLRLVLGGVLGLILGAVFVAVRALYRRRIDDADPDTIALKRAVTEALRAPFSRRSAQTPPPDGGR